MEKGGEKHQCVVASHAPPTGDLAKTQACALTGNQTSDPLVHRLALNPLNHTSQGSFWPFLSVWFSGITCIHTFTMLFNQLYYEFVEFFHLPKQKCPHSTLTPHFPPLPAPGKHHSTFSMNFSILGTSYKWNICSFVPSLFHLTHCFRSSSMLWDV